MAGKINDGRKHGRVCYQTGCECPERRVAAAEYMRDKRARDKAKASSMGTLRLVKPVAPVAAAEAPVRPRSYGRVGAAVLREIEAMPGATDRYPGIVELVLSLAAQIDGDTQPQLNVAAAKEIKLLLAEIRPAAQAPAAAAGPTAQERLLAKLAESL